MSARFPLLIVATSLGTLMAAGPAAAGDPCPIEFTFYELGAPSWLDRYAAEAARWAAWRCAPAHTPPQ